jgi:hypothetical protein
MLIRIKAVYGNGNCSENNNCPDSRPRGWQPSHLIYRMYVVDRVVDLKVQQWPTNFRTIWNRPTVDSTICLHRQDPEDMVVIETTRQQTRWCLQLVARRGGGVSSRHFQVGCNRFQLVS